MAKIDVHRVVVGAVLPTADDRPWARMRALFAQEAPVAAVLAAAPSQATDWDTQEAFRAAVVQHPTVRAFPPSTTFQRAVVRHFLARVEAAGATELSDPLYAHLAELNAQPDSAEGYQTFELPASPRAHADVPSRRRVLVPIRNNVHHNNVGLRMWEAGFLLTDLVLRRSVVRGKRVVELGAGLGLTGIAAAACAGAAHVVLTDCEPAVLANLEHNVQLAVRQMAAADAEHGADANAGAARSEGEGGTLPVDPGAALEAGRLSVRALDWREGGAHATQVCGPVDVVLAADVVYDVAVVPDLVQVISALLHGGAASGRCRPVAFVAATQRNEATLGAFLAGLDHAQLAWHELPTDDYLTTDGTTSPFHYRADAVRLFELAADHSHSGPEAGAEARDEAPAHSQAQLQGDVP